MLQQQIMELFRSLHRPEAPSDDLVLSLSVEEWMRLRGHVLCLARAEPAELDGPGEVRAAATALQGGLNPNELFALVEQSGFLPEVAEAREASALREFLAKELRDAPGPMVEKLWRATWTGDHSLSLFRRLDWPLGSRQVERVLNELAKSMENVSREDNGTTAQALARLLGHLGSLEGQNGGLAPSLVRAVAAGASYRFPLFERALLELPPSVSLAKGVFQQLGEHYLRKQRPFTKERLSMAALAILLKQLDPTGTSWLDAAKQSRVTDTLRGGLLWVGGIYSEEETCEVRACVDVIVGDITAASRVQPSLLDPLAGLIDVTVRFSEAEGEPLASRMRDLRRLSDRLPRTVLARELLLSGPHLFGRVSERAWQGQKSRTLKAAAADDPAASIALLNWPEPVESELTPRLWRTVDRNTKEEELLARLWETKHGIESIGQKLHRRSGPLSAGLKACFSSCTPVNRTMGQACQLIAQLLERSLRLSPSETQSLLDTTILRIPPGRVEMSSALKELVEEFLVEEPGPYSDQTAHHRLSSFYFRQWAPDRS